MSKNFLELFSELLDSKTSIETFRDIVHFRDKIEQFKKELCSLPCKFKSDDVKYFKDNGKSKLYYRFNPRLRDQHRNHKNQDERRNVGIYSTAVCLGTIAQYRNFNLTEFNYFTKVYYDNVSEFIILGLKEKLFDKDSTNPITQPGTLSKINTLIRYYNYRHKYSEINSLNHSVCNFREEKNLHELLVEILKDINNIISNKKEIENLHPYIIYKFFQLIELWEDEVVKAIETISTDFSCKKNLRDFAINIRKQVSNKSNTTYKKYFLNKIYPYAKYELYRQMALKQSGDMALYDVKRLLYSLLIVYIDDKFSNNLIRDQALAIIFDVQKKEPNALWPTGQLLLISKDSSESITTVECAYDLLCAGHSGKLLQAVCRYLVEFKNIFHSVLRAAQFDQDKSISGWYSFSQRDKTPTSWTTGLVLLFFKSFCQILSIEISQRAKHYFLMNYRSTSIPWNKLHDSTAVKSKLRLMIKFDDKDNTITYNKDAKTAMFFGPPGTGKTTLARALATKMHWKYLELTPGDFYSGGESEILPKINDIFYHLRYLEDTVVFIDEIDDLVISREEKEYDPRTLYVNTLLPRFQDIHDNGKIILIASTNHIEKVDKAISRLGRFDLIIPVGSMSIIGRINFLINEINERKMATEVSESFIALIKNYLGCTRDFTYSQVKLFVYELLKTIKNNMSILNGRVISDVNDKLGFKTTSLEFDAKKGARFIDDSNSTEIQFTPIRPLSLFDVESIKLERAFDNDKISQTDVINLCIYLFMLINKANVFTYSGIKMNNTLSDDEELKIIEFSNIIIKSLCNTTRGGDYYYSYLTPYFDSLELVYLSDKTKYSALKDSFDRLELIINNRSII